MSYILYIVIGMSWKWFCTKYGLFMNDTAWIVLAILTAAETISFRYKK